MGTRADFYVGKGETATWIGSIAWDGYRDGIDTEVLQAKSEAEFRAAVMRFFVERDDVTLPTRGWPWPWNTSQLTDCSYWFFDGKVWDAHGYPQHRYTPAEEPLPDSYDDGWYARHEPVEFPKMTVDRIALDGRSGLIFIAMPRDEP